MKTANQWSHWLKNISIKKTRKTRIVNPALFLKRMGELLTEGYTFSDAIHLVLPFHTKNDQEVAKLIQQSINNGEGIAEIFNILGFSTQLLVSLHVAEKSGEVANCLGHNASYLKALDEAKKKMKQLLTYPFVLFLFLSGIMFGFRHFFLPNLLTMQTSTDEEVSYFLQILPHIAVRLPDLFIGLLLMLAFGLVTSMVIYRTLLPGKKILFIQRLPIVQRYFFLWKTQQLTGELGNLLNSGFTIQDGLDVLTKQSNDQLLQEIAKQLAYYIQRGEPLHAAVRLVGYLPKQFSVYIEHGEISGYLGRELIIYSENLTNYLEEQMNRLFQLIQPVLFIIIACCIIAAYLALLLPMYQMIDTI